MQLPGYYATIEVMLSAVWNDLLDKLIPTGPRGMELTMTRLADGTDDAPERSNPTGSPTPAAGGQAPPVQCPLCEHLVPAGAKTCPHCGLDLSKTLPRTMGTFPLSPAALERVFRWGQSTLAGTQKLTLEIQGSSEPVKAELKERLVIGRYDRKAATNPDIDLTLFGARQKGVSRQHVALTREPDCVRVVDLGSTNSTYLNGYRLLPHQPRILRDGDELTLGRMVLTVKFE